MLTTRKQIVKARLAVTIVDDKPGQIVIVKGKPKWQELKVDTRLYVLDFKSDGRILLSRSGGYRYVLYSAIDEKTRISEFTARLLVYIVLDGNTEADKYSTDRVGMTDEPSTSLVVTSLANIAWQEDRRPSQRTAHPLVPPQLAT